MQVTTKTSVDFPKLKFGINAGEVRDLPEDKEAAVAILAHPDVVEIGHKEGTKRDKISNR